MRAPEREPDFISRGKSLGLTGIRRRHDLTRDNQEREERRKKQNAPAESCKSGSFRSGPSLALASSAPTAARPARLAVSDPTTARAGLDMLSRGSGVWGVDFDKSDPGEEGGIESQRWRRGGGKEREQKHTEI